MRNFFALVLILISNISFAQSSIGINFGVPSYTWSNDATAPFIISESTGSYALGLEFQKSTQKTISWGIDGTVHRLTNTIRSIEAYSSYSAGNKAVINLGLTPKLIYNFPFGESRFGGFLSIGPSLQWSSGSDRELNETNFRIVGKREIDMNGNVTNSPLEQLPYSSMERGNDFTFLIRPEAGVIFSVSEFSKFSARFQYGIGVGQALLVREFKDFPLEGNTSNSRHQLNGDFWTIQFGYQILLNNK